MAVVPFQSETPQVGEGSFIAPDAWVIGKTAVGKQVSIFFGAVLRGDIQRISVGDGSNIQEHALLHTSRNQPDCTVGKNVTVGHSAIIHGCTVEDNCIIGMGSVILDGAIIGKNSIVGAQALVPLNMKVPEGSLVMGVPAKVVRQLKPEEIAGITESAEHYQQLGAEYQRITSNR